MIVSNQKFTSRTCPLLSSSVFHRFSSSALHFDILSMFSSFFHVSPFIYPRNLLFSLHLDPLASFLPFSSFSALLSIFLYILSSIHIFIRIFLIICSHIFTQISIILLSSSSPSSPIPSWYTHIRSHNSYIPYITYPVSIIFSSSLTTIFPLSTWTIILIFSIFQYSHLIYSLGLPDECWQRPEVMDLADGHQRQSSPPPLGKPNSTNWHIPAANVCFFFDVDDRVNRVVLADISVLWFFIFWMVSISKIPQDS